MKKTKKISQWVFAVLCFIIALSFGFEWGSLLALICGIAVLPVESIRNIWKKVVPASFKWIKPTVIAVLFCTSMSLMPQTEVKHDIPDDNIKVEQNDVSDNAKEEQNEIADNDVESDNPVQEDKKEESAKPDNLSESTVDLSTVEAYSGKAYSELNNNKPVFAKLSTKSFEQYAVLDSLGRCGVAYACVGQDIMPTEERGSIGSVKPTGWHTVKYDIVDGNYLYNRCHLIGYQLTGENANTKNLITGTRYMNVEGMLPFENLVADYVQESGNHVMYRVTPHFKGNNLVASGVQMEAYSVEDNGAGVCFNVYVYNVQPGITINYANGESKLTNSSASSNTPSNTSSNTGSAENTSPSPNVSDSTKVWLSASGSKYHSKNDCGNMNPNKATQVTKEEAESRGKTPCSKCY